MNSQCQQILESIKWPSNILLLDFETFFDSKYSLKKLGCIEYIFDERFDFTGLGFYHPHCGIKFVGKPDIRKAIRNLKSRCGQNFDAVTIIVKNAKFDIRILKEKFSIYPKYIIDVEDLTRFYDSRMRHKLSNLAKTFVAKGEKGDTGQFSGLHYEDMTNEQRVALENYCKNDIDLELKLFDLFLPRISNLEFELYLARHTLNLSLSPKIEFDTKLAEELKSSMRAELSAKLNKVAWITDKEDDILRILRSPKKFPKILQKVLPEGETIPTKSGKRGPIFALAKSDQAFQEFLVHPNELVRDLCGAKEAAKSWPTHIKRIETMERQAKCYGGKLPIGLRYYGAHTGRASGEGGWNPQNLGGSGRMGKGIHPLIRQMRALLRAPSGYTFGIADSAQIEARVLAWLARENKLINGFARGEDIYSTFATKLFGHLVYKPGPDEPEPVAKLLTIKRGYAKDTILGCGYGLGPQKFYDNCMANENLRPFFDSGEYDFQFVIDLINAYRNTYNAIPKLWRKVEDAFRWAIKYSHRNATVNSLLEFGKDKHVFVELPSGRQLIYRHTLIDKSNNIAWVYGYLWGGSLVENIVQAIARDLLFFWVKIVEDSGIKVVLHSHDEIVTLLEENAAEYKIKQVCELMRSTPYWAEGLPLDVEGKISKVYCK